LQAAAAVAGLSDIVTTYVIFIQPSYRELNVMLESLATHGTTVAMGVFGTIYVSYLMVCSLDLGWASTAVGVIQVVLMGSGGLNNLLLFTTGLSLTESIGGAIAIGLYKPIAAGLLALLAAKAIHDRVPRDELAVGVLLFVAGIVVTHAVAYVV
jgi:hypothetical protein